MLPITLLKDEAYIKLLKMIHDGYFEYNQIYSLKTIAAELGMTRMPIRDALLKLESENFIDILPSRGFRLHALGEKELLQFYHFSCAIEGYCAMRLAEKTSFDKKNKFIEKLRELHDSMIHMDTEKNSYNEFFLLDKQFHHILITSLEDEYFDTFLASKHGFQDRIALHMIITPEYKEQIIKSHTNILNAICQSDPYGAYQAVLDHANIVYEKNKQCVQQSLE